MTDNNYNPNNNPSNQYFETPYDKGYTATPDRSESAVGYDIQVIEKQFIDIGLTLNEYIPGYWKKKRESRDQHEQDVFVLSC